MEYLPKVKWSMNPLNTRISLIAGFKTEDLKRQYHVDLEDAFMIMSRFILHPDHPCCMQ